MMVTSNFLARIYAAARPDKPAPRIIIFLFPAILYFFHIRLNHDLNKLFESCGWLPAELFPGFCCVSSQEVGFCWPEVPWVYDNDLFSGVLIDSDFVYAFAFPFESYPELDRKSV